MWNLKRTQMNLYLKQKQSHREQTCGCHRGEEVGEGWMAVGD